MQTTIGVAPPTRPAPGPRVDSVTGEVLFRLDSDDAWTPRRVWFHLRDYGADTTFHREGDQWVARIPRPPVARMEYLVVLAGADGGEIMVPDPANPRRVRGVFGDHSLIEFPGYAPPWWIAVADAAEAQSRRDAQAAEAAARRRGSGPVPTPWRRPWAPAGAGFVPVQVPVAGVQAQSATSTGPEAGAARPGEGVASVRVRPRSTGDDRILRTPSALAHPSSPDQPRQYGHATPDPDADPSPNADPDPYADADPGPSPGHDPGTPTGTLVHTASPDPVIDAEAAVSVTGQLHVPADSTPREALPLLVVHDGPEYADLAQLLRYLATLARIDPDLRCRVLLLTPVDRDRSYSASPAYARALVTGMLPQVTAGLATAGRPVGVGASLGGLSLMHAALAHPGTFAGVFSQSGSFFRPRFDGRERGYRFYNRIVRFVDTIDTDPARLADLRVTLTCGTGEENLDNNRALARRLARIEVPVDLIENPDGHNYTGWRDCLDPGLRRLLRSVWGGNIPH